MDFLQGQITADIHTLNQQPIIYSALCNPKGRVLADIYLIKHPNQHISLLCHESLADEIHQRLQKFAQFSKTTCSQTDQCISGHTAAPPQGLQISWKPDLWLSWTEGKDAHWQTHEITAGIPRVTAETAGQFTAHMLSLDYWHALSLQKGCYVGQEIIARTHYRGQTKKRLWQIAITEKAKPMQVLEFPECYATVVTCNSTHALAVGPLDLDKKTPSLSIRPHTPQWAQA